MVEARFARIKYAMIAEVMRTNGAGEYQADLIEKELLRLNRVADPYAKSIEDFPTPSRPAEEKFNEITADIAAKVSAQFMEQIKTSSATNREEVNETLQGVREDIKNVRTAILEKVTDVFRPDAVMSDHRSKKLDYQTSDRASQTTRDASCQPDKAQYQKQAQPLLCESPGHQSLHMPVQQLALEQCSVIRSIKNPELMVKEDGLASAKLIRPRDRSIDSARRTSVLPNDQNMDLVRQLPKTYLHSEKVSPRKHPVPSEQVTDSAKKQNTRTTCRKCSKCFENRASLHNHLRSGSHYGPFPPLVTGTESTGAATEASAKPKREIKANGPDYSSFYRPTEADRGPPQMDGTRDIFAKPNPAAQLLPPETLSTTLVERVNRGPTCQVCHESFESKKELHTHLKDEGHLRTRDDQVLLAMLPTGPKKAKKFNLTGSENKSQIPRR